MKAHPYALHVAGQLRAHGFPRVRLEEEVKKRGFRHEGRDFIPFDIGFLAFAPQPHREYVECKYRTGQVSERSVAKFLLDLETCGLPTRYGMLVTNGDFQPLAVDYARHAGLRLYRVAMEETQGLFHHARERPLATIRHLFFQARNGTLPPTFRRYE